MVVGTHAHDHHISGLSRILDECSAATFVCSSALTSEEFVAGVLEADADIEALFRKSIRSECRRICDILDKRDPGAAKYTFEQRLLWPRDASARAPGAPVTALSPSDHAIRKAIEKLAAGLAKAGDRRRLVSADPNEFAVALSVTVGEIAMLLGAELERAHKGVDGVLSWRHQARHPCIGLQDPPPRLGKCPPRRCLGPARHHRGHFTVGPVSPRTEVTTLTGRY